MRPSWLRRFGDTDPDEDVPSASERRAFDALDQTLTAFASDPEPFDEEAAWAKFQARMSQSPRGSRLLPSFARWTLPRTTTSMPRVAAGALAAAALIAAVTLLSVLLTGNDVARAEFFDTVDALDELSNDALADGQISQDEAAALNEQAAIVEQTFEDDPAAVANSSADATSNAIDALKDVRARLLERTSVAAEEAGPTANAVAVLERVTNKLEEAARGGRGQGQGNQGQAQGSNNADERGRGQGNQGQGLGNAPAIEDANGGANPGGGSGGQP